MHKHEGIVVVAYKCGQPRSEVEALLQIANLEGGFTTNVVDIGGELDEGVAAKVNLYQEALDLVDDLVDAGLNGLIIESGEPTTWAIE